MEVTLNENEEKRLRLYLLGGLSETERAEIEQQLFAENVGGDLVEQLQIIEEELIDEYAAERLSGRERKAFERLFLPVPARRTKIRLAKGLLKAAAEAPQVHEMKVETEAWWRVFLVPSWQLAVFAVLVIGLGFGVWRVFVYQPRWEEGREMLAKAYAQERPFEARVAGFAYAPAAPVTRGPEDKPANYLELARAEAVLREAVTDEPSPEAWHALGQFHLMGKEFDKAIEELEKSLALDPNNARVQNDLGVALMGKAMAAGDPTALAESYKGILSHFDRAIGLDRSLLEAEFNKTLLRQAFVGQENAPASLVLEEWRRYLQRDSTSGWSAEARRNMQRLEIQR